MRRRANPDAALLTYRYWARPIEIPDAMWATARAMQALWNQLVAARAAFAARVDASAPKASAKLAWKAWDAEARALVAASGLNWECGPAILERFQSACKAAAKGQHGWPTVHRRLDHINITHRYTGGGEPIGTLFSRRAKRVSLCAAPALRVYAANDRDSRRARLMPPHRDGRHPDQEWCRFGLDNGAATIRFRLMMHRPLPSDATVKRVSWIGRRHPTKGWQWALTVTLELRREEQRLQRYRRCGLDLGWRLCGDYVRIGYLVDDAGREMELRLPLDAPTAHTRRHGIESGWRDLLRIDTLLGQNVERAKALLRDYAPETVALWHGFTAARQGALVRQLRDLERTGAHSPEDIVSITVLRSWLARNDRWRSRRMALWDRWLGRRQWLYRNLAAWLCQTYGTIAWEGDLAIKRMAEAKKSPALEAADRYRHAAAIGELRLYIQQAAAKMGTCLLPLKAAHTTDKCTCGAPVTGDRAAMVLACEAGHARDQDQTAAHNLFSQIERPGEQTDDSRIVGVGDQSEVGKMSEQLRAVVAVVHLGSRVEPLRQVGEIQGG